MKTLIFWFQFFVYFLTITGLIFLLVVLTSGVKEQKFWKYFVENSTGIAQNTLTPAGGALFVDWHLVPQPPAETVVYMPCILDEDYKYIDTINSYFAVRQSHNPYNPVVYGRDPHKYIKHLGDLRVVFVKGSGIPIPPLKVGTYFLVWRYYFPSYKSLIKNILCMFAIVPRVVQIQPVKFEVIE